MWVTGIEGSGFVRYISKASGIVETCLSFARLAIEGMAPLEILHFLNFIPKYEDTLILLSNEPVLDTNPLDSNYRRFTGILCGFKIRCYRACDGDFLCVTFKGGLDTTTRSRFYPRVVPLITYPPHEAHAASLEPHRYMYKYIYVSVPSGLRAVDGNYRNYRNYHCWACTIPEKCELRVEI